MGASVTSSSFATTIEFQVTTRDKMSTYNLDRIEARMILLSKGGLAAQRFDEQLVQRLREVGIKDVTRTTRTLIHEPQLILPRKVKAGRLLTQHDLSLESQNAAAPAESGEHLLKDDDETASEDAVFHAIVLAGLLGAVFVAGTLIYFFRMRRRSQLPVRPQMSNDARQSSANTINAPLAHTTVVS